MSQRDSAPPDARELSRAVRYIQTELETHLELSEKVSDTQALLTEALIGVTNALARALPARDLSRAVDNLFKTIEELDRAAEDLIAGAYAEAGEKSSPVNAATLEKVRAEIARRSKWDAEARLAQESLEDLCAEKRDLSCRLGELLEHEASENPLGDKKNKMVLDAEVARIEKNISEMVANIAENETAISTLRNYMASAAAISKPPMHLLEKTLPVIPEQIKTPATV